MDLIIRTKWTHLDNSSVKHLRGLQSPIILKNESGLQGVYTRYLHTIRLAEGQIFNEHALIYNDTT